METSHSCTKRQAHDFTWLAYFSATTSYYAVTMHCCFVSSLQDFVVVTPIFCSRITVQKMTFRLHFVLWILVNKSEFIMAWTCLRLSWLLKYVFNIPIPFHYFWVAISIFDDFTSFFLVATDRYSENKENNKKYVPLMHFKLIYKFIVAHAWVHIIEEPCTKY